MKFIKVVAELHYILTKILFFILIFHWKKKSNFIYSLTAYRHVCGINKYTCINIPNTNVILENIVNHHRHHKFSIYIVIFNLNSLKFIHK